MTKTIIILYLISFGVYVLFTRQPDYFDGIRTSGTIKMISDSTHQLVPYADFSADEKNYQVAAGYPLRQLKQGEKVTIIYEDAQPGKAAIYAWWGYWIRWKEVLASIALILVLFQVAVALTSNPTPEALLQELEGRKKKKRRYE